MVFAIKAEVSDPQVATFTFSAQKTMYGGKHIVKGDTIFIFASENEGGSGLIASGLVTSAKAITRKRGVARQTPRVSLTIRRTAVTLRTTESGASKQVWLLKPDGSSPRAVTTTPTFTHGAYQWDATSRFLVFQRFELGVPFAKPEVMVWSWEMSEPRLLVKDASLPAWLP